MKIKKKGELIVPFLFWIIFILIFTYRLTKFPIFEDEAINLSLSESLLNNPLSNFFIFMRRGFLPTLGWFIFPFRFFIKDSLLAGRLANVLLASSLFYWFYLIKNTFKLPMRFFVLSGILFTLSPILFLNSRVALFDTAVMVFSAWSLYFFYIILNRQKPIFQILFFVVFLSCLLIKFTSLFVLPGLIYLLYKKYEETKKFTTLKRPTILLLLTLVCFVIIISPFYFSVSGDLLTGLVFNLGGSDIFNRIHQNFWLFINWFKVYYPVFFICPFFFVILVLGGRKKSENELMTALLIWLITSISVMVCFNRFFYPRHILILLLPLVIVPIFILLKYPLKVSIFFTMFVALARITLFRDLVFDTTFRKAEMAKEDRFQYFEDYTSGININEIAGYLSGKAVKNPDEKMIVWLDGSWVMDYGLRRALKDVPNIEFKSFSDSENQRSAIPGKIIKTAGPNYVVINRYWPLNIKDLVLEKEFNWGGYHPEYVYVFKR